ncbi:MAG: glutamate-5-semialdehyde dehydrogenase [Omnitrophica WOR_2 bacterium RBG_13_44_8b]|nr:MAG: glutamate-5-semialdehyde dehydrogenase [Omnitrophica WOR_2 bacterium RBG_13_44_8b]
MATNLKKQLTQIAARAKQASGALSNLSSTTKNKILQEMARALQAKRGLILKANRKDLAKAKAARLADALIDRLALNDKRIKEMSESLVQISRLNDPVGKVIRAWLRPNGLWIHKVRVPIGVIAIIYESRPNVTSDCIGLCFKSGNSVILRGGSESLNSNLAIFHALNQVLKKHHLADGIINMVGTVDRKAVDILLKLDDFIDLVIPRGGENLIKHVASLSRIPVIKHYKGICIVYVDKSADLSKAQAICFNAKVQRPGVCNAMESMLVHKAIAARFLPAMARKFNDAGVEIRGCPVTRKIVKSAKPATEQDYHTEYLALKLSVKVVNDLEQAISHTNYYGTHHSDAIVTQNYESALEFLRRVDSACVYVNASTRFTDGYQFGMGAEIGISTDKLHARGPMALEELTTYKYMIFGSGQVRG